MTRIEPGVDGVILSSGGRRGTFLPAVWDSLQDPRAFIEALKMKAGFPRDHWSKDVSLHRFRVESFAETVGVSR